MADAIRIEGLTEFVRDLKTIDRDAPKVLRVAFNATADAVVADARSRMPSRSGRARGTVKAKSTQTAVRVSEGSARAPYVPWLDFGGRVGKSRSVNRPFLKEGRYLYDAYYRNKPRMAELLETALIDAARAAGVEVD